MNLLFPGRHQLLTNFQFDYLRNLISGNTDSIRDINGKILQQLEPVTAIIFAVTSANHHNTRRNPLPFYLRAMAIQDFGRDLNVPAYIYGIDDVGSLENFATYTLKRVRHESEGLFDLNRDNTWVICSTPVLEMYEDLGFKILPAELTDRKSWQHNQLLPWDIVEKIATHDLNDADVMSTMHTSSYELWKKYKLDARVHLLFRDKMIGDDGDITTTRDYNTYVRQMDEIAGLKYQEVIPYVHPGRIGDIGCAVGSWIKLACQDLKLRESDFYGVEVARHLFDICEQRKHNGEFKNPFVFFSQRNAVTGLAFEKNSMNTIHTSSLTHEIESYGSREELLQFIRNRYEELATGGIWINRDVVGPPDKDKLVWMKLSMTDGRNDDWNKTFDSREGLAKYLSSLSTYGRFFRFATDFRKSEEYTLHFDTTTFDDEMYITLTLRDACEFMSRKDYTDNWESEMHEQFCYWDFEEWKEAVSAAGFFVLPESHASPNLWIIKNRLEGKVALFEKVKESLQKLEYPVSHMILLAGKQ